MEGRKFVDNKTPYNNDFLIRANYNLSLDKKIIKQIDKPNTSFYYTIKRYTPYNKWYDDENMSYKETLVHFIISFKVSS